jgi:hypothetical protein
MKFRGIRKGIEKEDFAGWIQFFILAKSRIYI